MPHVQSPLFQPIHNRHVPGHNGMNDPHRWTCPVCETDTGASSGAVGRDAKARRRPPRVRDRGCSWRERELCVMSLARAASSATPSTSTSAVAKDATVAAPRDAGMAGRSRVTRGSGLGSAGVSCALGRIPRGYRRATTAAWRALPRRTLDARALRRPQGYPEGHDYGTSRRSSVWRVVRVLAGLRSERPSPTHVARASTGVETTTAEAVAAAAAADVASGKLASLRARAEQALQHLGKGPNWRLFDVFDQLRDANDAIPNAHVATVLSVAGRRGELRRVRGVMDWMKIGAGRRADGVHATAYIQAVGAAGAGTTRSRRTAPCAAGSAHVAHVLGADSRRREGG